MVYFILKRDRCICFFLLLTYEGHGSHPVSMATELKKQWLSEREATKPMGAAACCKIVH